MVSLSLLDDVNCLIEFRHFQKLFLRALIKVFLLFQRQFIRGLSGAVKG